MHTREMMGGGSTSHALKEQLLNNSGHRCQISCGGFNPHRYIIVAKELIKNVSD